MTAEQPLPSDAPARQPAAGMFSLIRQQPRLALLVLGLPALIAVVYLALVVNHALAYNDGYLGAVLDDTWIHVRFADSISQGQGLSYNAGTVTSGATSPLWVMSLGVVFAFLRPEIDSQVHIAVMASAVGFVVAVMAISGFGWSLTRRAWVGLMAGLFTALAGRLVWMGLSGMEITTFTALTILALWSHLHDLRDGGRPFGWRTGILAALATLARPEGYLLALLIGLDAVVIAPLLYGRGRPDLRWWQPQPVSGSNGRDNPDRPGRRLPWWRGVVAYLLLAGSYPLATLLMDGYPLPNTFRVKSNLGKEAPDLLYGFFWTPRVDYGWLVIVVAGIGLGWLLWRIWRATGDAHARPQPVAWPLWPIAFVIGVLYLGPEHYVVNNSRYVAPAIPHHGLLAAVGLMAVFDGASAAALRLPRPVLGRAAPLAGTAALALLLLGAVFWQGRAQGHNVANDVAQLRMMHVTAGEWFRERTEPGDRIALNDVGAIVHISDRAVLDMVGLVSPEVIAPLSQTERFTCPHDLALMRVMLQQPPKFIGIFPWFFPCLTNLNGSGFSDLLQPEAVFTITGPTVIAGGELVVYWPRWENWPVQPAVPDDVPRVDVPFADGITLAGVALDRAADAWDVTLWWQADAQPQGDYTAFVHLIDADGQIVTQRDSRPRRGEFNTAWWREGDIVPDPRRISPEDPARLAEVTALRIGLYPTDGGDRLPRLTAPPAEPDFVVIPLVQLEEDAY